MLLSFFSDFFINAFDELSLVFILAAVSLNGAHELFKHFYLPQQSLFNKFLGECELAQLHKGLHLDRTPR